MRAPDPSPDDPLSRRERMKRRKIDSMPDAIGTTLSAGFVLDLLLGDPFWLPHPVRLIGRLALWAEPRCRSIVRHEYLAGAVFALGIVLVMGGGVGLVPWGLQQIHPVAAGLAMVYFMFTGLAVRDLAQEAWAVWRALQAHDLDKARRQLSRIVGRDTDHL